MSAQGLEIFVIAGAVGQLDVEVAGLLAERVVPGAVQREREDAGIVAEDGGGAVALVHVAVHHRDPPAPALVLHDAGGDGHVVEHAVALAAIGEGMMGAPGEVDGRALDQRRPGRGDGGAGRAPRPLDHRRRPREADAADHLRGQRAGGDSGDVVGSVDQGQCLPGRSRRLDEVAGRDDALGDHPLAQSRVLGHREPVAVGQRQHEVVGVVGAHRRRQRSRSDNGVTKP